ncbi:inorganic triphosphatase [Shewanella sp. YIC-542]|uniref:CYTH domain-containing protein n=1 Tax=Shewanella mytili TaxID=3377111 RepID=UPI00398E41A3
MKHDNNHTEIELKLFILPQYQTAICHFFDQLSASEYQGSHQLSNRYFDTPALTLRQWDMGLRVRGCNAQYEQTIKTAGRVVGGLHSRPEYNVAIEATSPELSLFPAEIWPDDTRLSDVQAQLKCFFHTDFQRQRWWVHQGQSLIEVALDQGTIIAGDCSEPLCELEFELLSGVAGDLLPLAQQLAKQIPVRLGKASKAQRGYRLAAGKPVPAVAPLAIALSATASPNGTLATVLEALLERWQVVEDVLAQQLVADIPPSQSRAQTAVHLALWQQMHGCVQALSDVLTHSGLAGGELREGFNWLGQHLACVPGLAGLGQLLSPQGLPDELPAADMQAAVQAALGLAEHEPSIQHLQQLWQNPRYGTLQLQLVQLLMALQQGEPLLASYADGKAVSGAILAASWQPLARAITSPLDAPACLALAAPLMQALFISDVFSGIYPEKTQALFCRQWQALGNGFARLQAWTDAEKLLPAQAPVLAQNRQHLLLALRQLCERAATLPPYWH